MADTPQPEPVRTIDLIGVDEGCAELAERSPSDPAAWRKLNMLIWALQRIKELGHPIRCLTCPGLLQENGIGICVLGSGARWNVPPAELPAGAIHHFICRDCAKEGLAAATLHARVLAAYRRDFAVRDDVRILTTPSAPGAA